MRIADGEVASIGRSWQIPKTNTPSSLPSTSPTLQSGSTPLSSTQVSTPPFRFADRRGLMLSWRKWFATVWANVLFLCQAQPLILASCTQPGVSMRGSHLDQSICSPWFCAEAHLSSESTGFPEHPSHLPSADTQLNVSDRHTAQHDNTPRRRYV